MSRQETPSIGSPNPESLGSVLERNIHALRKREEHEEKKASLQDRAADIITRFSGSMAFVYLHLFLVGGGLPSIWASCPASHGSTRLS